MKLFDTLVKPIALYGCEVWGAFGHKSNILDNIFNNLLLKDKSSYEQLHLKSCKHILGISKRASNLGSRSELGRYPLMFNILLSICKYRMRLECSDHNDLLFHGLKSQQKLYLNSYRTLTYNKFTDKLFIESVGKIPTPLSKTDDIKSEINKSITPIKNKITNIYQKLFFDILSGLQTETSTKLTIFSNIKRNYKYEPYLDVPPNNRYITKFRLSDHNLPIERGRYHRPKIPRNERLCSLCNNEIGDEIHALLQCKNLENENIRTKFIKQITFISSQFGALSDDSKLEYILNSTDPLLTPIIGKWINNITLLYNK